MATRIGPTGTRLTLEEIQSRLLDKCQQKAGIGSIWRFFHRHGISFKKKACVPASRIGLTWRQRARPGRTCKLSSIPSVSSASRRPAPQLTWPAYVAALRVRPDWRPHKEQAARLTPLTFHGAAASHAPPSVERAISIECAWKSVAQSAYLAGQSEV
jgi:hypothetical protein